MVGFWLFEFQKNSDVTQVEYNSMNNIYADEDLRSPSVSICFDTPFLRNERFNLSLIKDFKSKYYNFLSGDDTNEKFGDIDYLKVTPVLEKYIKEIEIIFRNGRKYNPELCKDIKKCPYYAIKNKYNGFSSENQFIKCYDITINKDYVKDVVTFRLMLDRSFKEVIDQITFTQVSVHYRNQFFRPHGGSQSIWPKNDGARIEVFQITSMEWLKRRNRRQKPCEEIWYNFDKLVWKSHLRVINCKALYLLRGTPIFKQYPICTTQQQLKEWKNRSMAGNDGQVALPCKEASSTAYKHYSLSNGENSTETYDLWISYPQIGKVINQLREIDEHTLIGNIGGYIGLFLGKILSYRFDQKYCNGYIISSIILLKHSIQIYTFISGYAIIQLPEFLLSLYNILFRQKSKAKEKINVVETWNEKSLKERIERLDSNKHNQ